MTTIEQSDVIPAAPEAVYDAITNPEQHAEFTGSPATGEPVVGGAFTAHGGYIFGTFVVLCPTEKIVQQWQTTQWPQDAPPSIVSWSMKGRKDGTTDLTLIHSKVPVEQAESYRQGWIDYYWTPLKTYLTQH